MARSFTIAVQQVPLQNSPGLVDAADVEGDTGSAAAKAAVPALKEAAGLAIDKFAVGRDGYVDVTIEATVSDDEGEGRDADEFTISVRRVAPPEGSSPTPSQPQPDDHEPPQPDVTIDDAAGTARVESGVGATVDDVPTNTEPTVPGATHEGAAVTHDPAHPIGWTPPDKTAGDVAAFEQTEPEPADTTATEQPAEPEG